MWSTFKTRSFIYEKHIYNSKNIAPNKKTHALSESSLELPPFYETIYEKKAQKLHIEKVQTQKS